MKTIGRIVQFKLHRRGQRASAFEPLVTPGGIQLVQILEEIGFDLFGWKEIVLLRPLVLNQPEDRLVPVDAILGRGQADPGIGAVPHWKELFPLLENHRIDPHLTPFPGFVRPQDGIDIRLLRRIQDPRGVADAFEQVVVDEQLSAGPDAHQGRWSNPRPSRLLLFRGRTDVDAGRR